MKSNPRTAIAQVGTNHYLVVVSEGRTDDSQGLSLSELATVLKNHGAKPHIIWMVEDQQHFISMEKSLIKQSAEAETLNDLSVISFL